MRLDDHLFNVVIVILVVVIVINVVVVVVVAVIIRVVFVVVMLTGTFLQLVENGAYLKLSQYDKKYFLFVKKMGKFFSAYH